MAGFIGHNLSISLQKKGYNCQVIDSLEVNNYKSKKHKKPSSLKLYNEVPLERFRLLKKIKLKLMLWI